MPTRLTGRSAHAAHEHLPLAMLVVELVRPRRLVQLGLGSDLNCALCQTVAELGIQAAVYGIGLGTDADVLERLKGYQEARYGHFAQLVETDALAASELFGDGSIDLLVATPATGSFTDVIPLWMPKLSERGVLLLLGLHHHVGAALEIARPYPCVSFTHGGGAVLALVGDHQPEAALDVVAASADALRPLRRLLARVGDHVSATVELIERDARISALEEDHKRLGRELDQIKRVRVREDNEDPLRVAAGARTLEQVNRRTTIGGLDFGDTQPDGVPRGRSTWWTSPLHGARRLAARARLIPPAHRRLWAPHLLRSRSFTPLLPPTRASRQVRRRPPLRELSTTVSVIIPTLNSGPVLERVLGSIRQQRGIGNLEILVVDSGSTDGTIELARRYDAVVREVPQAEFNHGATRDAAAEHASGEILLMTVQDAILAGPDALRTLVLELEDDPRMIGISPRQIPRADTDLYGAYAVWAHQAARLSWRSNGRRKSWHAMSPTERRAAAQLDNVCAAIRRDAWSEIRFRSVAFGEDLDFGIRAAQRGWSVGASDRAAVIHSHTRSAAYHVRRMVVDRIYSAELLGVPLDDECVDLDRVAAAAHELVGRLQAAFAFVQTPREEIDLCQHLARVAEGLRLELPMLDPAGSLAEIADLCGRTERADREASTKLRSELVDQLESGSPMRFAEAHRSVPATEANAFIAKLAAARIGEVAGDALRAHPSESELAVRLRSRV